MVPEDDSRTLAESAEQQSTDANAEASLENAPSEGETISDFFAFEEIFTRVLSTADHELEASNRYLFWSGLGAGGAIGLTFVARVIFTDLAGESEPGIVGNLLYPLGFLIIVLGRYQLFTENTLTPVVLVLMKLASVANLFRLWLVVLIANLLGALAVAAILAFFDVFTPARLMKAIEIGHHAYMADWFQIFSKAMIAGWVVAAMVWLVHSGRDSVSKILSVFILMYFIGVGGFFHVITSSVEVFFLSFRTDVSFLSIFPNFILPVLLGNTIGGVIFVAVLNWAMFAEHEDSEIFERYGERLPWREWAFGVRREKQVKTARNPSDHSRSIPSD